MPCQNHHYCRQQSGCYIQKHSSWRLSIGGCPSVDLFTTWFNRSIATFFSPVADPLAWSNNLLAISWDHGRDFTRMRFHHQHWYLWFFSEDHACKEPAPAFSALLAGENMVPGLCRNSREANSKAPELTKSATGGRDLNSLQDQKG